MNAAIRKNLNIILDIKLNTLACRLNREVVQHMENIFMTKEQLAARNADVHDPIHTQLLIKSLPENAHFDRLRSMVESKDDNVDTSENVRNQILWMESCNTCYRHTSVHCANVNLQGHG